MKNMIKFQPAGIGAFSPLLMQYNLVVYSGL